MNSVVLRLTEVSKSFTGVQVLYGLNFDLKRGEIHGLVGENGAGKSTLMNIIGGVLPMDTGKMELKGKPYTPRNPFDAVESGIAFIHQELNLFTNLTVAENLFIDNFPKKWSGVIDRKVMQRATEEQISRFSLPVLPDTKVETLPAGMQQIIEIAKGLMKNACIMIFDEPTTSLSTREKKTLFNTILELKTQRISVIYISHILEDVFRLCDRITVIRDGVIVDTRDSMDFSKKDLIRCMVGREMKQVFPTIVKIISDIVLLEAKGICWGNQVKDVSFALQAGEMVGMYGLMGAGRTELAKVLFGVERADAGEVVMNGRSLSVINPEVCIGEHTAFITEDRHHEGLLMIKSVCDNLGLVKMPALVNRIGMVNTSEQDRYNHRAIEALHIKVTNYKEQLANSLSGGNQQKVVFGKWVMNDPRILILDEPTRGVDVGAKFEIYTIIANLAKAGSAILFISSEIEELIGMCDRILVMSGGRIISDVPKTEFDQERILELALQGAG